jgi:hypothetical protein
MSLIDDLKKNILVSALTDFTEKNLDIQDLSREYQGLSIATSKTWRTNGVSAH